MSDEQPPPRQLNDADFPEPLAHVVRMIERLAEQSAALDAATQRKIERLAEQSAALDAATQQKIERLSEQSAAADAATQKKIEFILEQQAHSETRVDRSETRLVRVERVAKLIVRAGMRARREMRVQDERLAALIGVQERNAEAIARLAESQAHTDRRLDALIDIVREGRNGKGGEK
jgi:hypothetical protein